MKTPGTKRQTRGFTLIEMIMVIVITGVIASLAGMLLQHGVRAYVLSGELTEIDWQGRLALERLLRDLRRMRSASPGDLTMTPADRITFVDSDNQTISYALSGATLTRNGQPLADGISTLNFDYLRNDGKTTAATAGEVFYISVSFTISQGDSSRNLHGTVFPRSLR